MKNEEEVCCKIPFPDSTKQAWSLVAWQRNYIHSLACNVKMTTWLHHPELCNSIDDLISWCLISLILNFKTLNHHHDGDNWRTKMKMADWCFPHVCSLNCQQVKWAIELAFLFFLPLCQGSDAGCKFARSSPRAFKRRPTLSLVVSQQDNWQLVLITSASAQLTHTQLDCCYLQESSQVESSLLILDACLLACWGEHFCKAMMINSSDLQDRC